MATGSIFVNNRAQAVRIPVGTRFPEGVKEVIVTVFGKDRVLSPVINTRDTFFMSEEKMTDDFMAGRVSQEQQDREAF